MGASTRLGAPARLGLGPSSGLGLGTSSRLGMGLGRSAGLGLGMGPWEAARSRAELAGLGVTCPAIDQGYIERAARPR